MYIYANYVTDFCISANKILFYFANEEMIVLRIMVTVQQSLLLHAVQLCSVYLDLPSAWSNGAGGVRVHNGDIPCRLDWRSEVNTLVLAIAHWYSLP